MADTATLPPQQRADIHEKIMLMAYGILFPAPGAILPTPTRIGLSFTLNQLIPRFFQVVSQVVNVFGPNIKLNTFLKAKGIPILLLRRRGEFIPKLRAGYFGTSLLDASYSEHWFVDRLVN